MARLSGKRVLMTGGGGLLGSDLARALAVEGADIVLTTRTTAKLEPLAGELRDMGARVVTVGADFTRNDDIDRLGPLAWNAFGSIDVVIFSSQPPNPNLGDLLSSSDEIYREQQQAIVWGPLRLMRYLAPLMMGQGGGSIISLTSSTGSEPVTGYSAYGMAKNGLWVLTRYMAKEWGHGGIRASAVQPGLVATGDNADELTRAVAGNGILSRTSLGRVGRNSDCVGAVIYLASDESSFTSGQRICVDGGRF